MGTPPKVIVVGGANTDFIIQVPHLPAKGETVLGGTFHTARGGKGANQAVAAARLGGEVTFITRLGADRLGSEAIEAYQNEGICTDYILRDPQRASGVALILVDNKGENMIAVDPGASLELSPADLQSVEKVMKEADLLLVQLEITMETAIAAIGIASRNHVRVVLNPAPAIEIPNELYGLIDVLTPNEKEAAILTGSSGSNNRTLMAELAKKTGTQHIIMTRGEKGARVYSQGQITDIPAFQVAALDTTACGDAFNGALAVALGRGEDLLQAVSFANVVGALTATRLGAQPSLPTAQEVDDFMASKR